MYSVILMAALATNGPDAVEFGHRHGGCYGCGGCYGGCYGSCYGSCYGCVGAYSGSSPIWYGGTVMPSGNPVVAPQPQVPAQKLDAPKPGEGNAARLIIDAPAEASLFVDDKPFTLNNHEFTTPPLTPGKTYFYTVRVEMNRDGKTASESRKVLVRANQTTRESFNVPTNTTTVAMESR